MKLLSTGNWPVGNESLFHQEPVGRDAQAGQNSTSLKPWTSHALWIHLLHRALYARCADQTVPVIDAASGQVRRAQILVAVLGTSDYTCACATPQAERGGLDRLVHRSAQVHRRGIAIVGASTL
jgi:hypothetical protein